MRALLLVSCAFGLSACQVETPAFLAPPVEAGTTVDETPDAPEVLASTEEIAAAPEALEGGERADVALGEETLDPHTAEVVAGADQILAETTEVRRAGLGGMFAFLKPKRDEAQVEEVAMPVEEGFEARPETHGVAPELPEQATPTEPKSRKPLFGFLQSQPKDAPVSTVKPGELLAFGEVGINCEIRPRAMGEKVDQFPREGRPVWQLYDSDPSSIEPRSQYITGFSDGCARQVTAALTMFGAAGLHEVLRYSDHSERDWSQADKTYEKIKRQACGVGRGEYCPAASLDALERQVAFVSVYPYFGAEEDWLELLLHDGQVMSEEMR
ncbi:hypothetical protein HCZ23_13980 [Celeribacter sp. HF31]|uniref:hypothetical protein n=1 Tax=Celeribacter sp. HF31 TaxID=2721558 RepID=UPI001431A538|nr:hypothetical protein [Celeribacter sp. HF31]NIY80571.1 hypothetical protein [Celeribacter sp. HF31]